MMKWPGMSETVNIDPLELLQRDLAEAKQQLAEKESARAQWAETAAQKLAENSVLGSQLATAIERAEKAGKHISSLMDEIDKADKLIAALTRERDKAKERIEVLANERDAYLEKAERLTYCEEAIIQSHNNLTRELEAERERADANWKSYERVKEAYSQAIAVKNAIEYVAAAYRDALERCGCACRAGNTELGESPYKCLRCVTLESHTLGAEMLERLRKAEGELR